MFIMYVVPCIFHFYTILTANCTVVPESDQQGLSVDPSCMPSDTNSITDYGFIAGVTVVGVVLILTIFGCCAACLIKAHCRKKQSLSELKSAER